MSPFTEAALGYLLLRCNKSHLHPMDEDQVKVTLRVIKKQDPEMDIYAMHDWLDDHEWADSPKKLFLKWAKAVQAGKKPRTQYPGAPTENAILSIINKKLAEG